MKHRQVITIVILLPCLSIFGPSAVAQASINKPTVDRCLADIGGQVYVDDAEFIMGNDATYPEEWYTIQHLRNGLVFQPSGWIPMK